MKVQTNQMSQTSGRASDADIAVPRLDSALAVGPDQSWARALVRSFDPVARVHAGLAILGEQERELRVRQLRATLIGGGAPEAAVDGVSARFAAAPEAPAGLALYVAADGTVLHEQMLPDVEAADRADYTAPAGVIPLLAWAQDRPPYILVVIDRAGADLTASAGGTSPVRTWSITGPDDEIERNAPGGSAQPRYQRRAEDSWAHNAGQAADAVIAGAAEVGAQALIVSGDVRAVQLMLERLPREPAIPIAHITGGRSADGSQAVRAKLVEHALRDVAATQTRHLLQQFHAHLNPGGISVEGREDTVAALAAGRVATVLVTDSCDENDKIWFGADGYEIYLDHESALLAQRPIRSGNLADVAVRSALLSGGKVRVIPADTEAGPIDGIGAICRHGRG